MCEGSYASVQEHGPSKDPHFAFYVYTTLEHVRIRAIGIQRERQVLVDVLLAGEELRRGVEGRSR